jgi:hypothetical protein
MGGKDTVDSGIRVSAGVGLGALALSVVVAGFSRIPLGTLVLRAVLFGVLFAVLAYVVHLLFQRFLPELFEDGVVTQSNETGRMVDIVLPGEESDLDATPVERIDYLDQESGITTSDPLAVTSSRLDSKLGVYSGVLNGSAVGNLEQEVRDAGSNILVTGPDSSNPGISKGLRPIVSLDQLDVLPDLDGMSDVFTATPGPGSGDEPDGFKPEALSGTGRTNGSDPVVIAKAVQTLLRRDQKGQ